VAMIKFVPSRTSDGHSAKCREVYQRLGAVEQVQVGHAIRLESVVKLEKKLDAMHDQLQRLLVLAEGKK